MQSITDTDDIHVAVHIEVNIKQKREFSDVIPKMFFYCSNTS